MTNLSERLTTVRASKVNCECRNPWALAEEKKKRKEKKRETVIEGMTEREISINRVW